jgi:hypothetical protein
LLFLILELVSDELREAEERGRQLQQLQKMLALEGKYMLAQVSNSNTSLTLDKQGRYHPYRRQRKKKKAGTANANNRVPKSFTTEKY